MKKNSVGLFDLMLAISIYCFLFCTSCIAQQDKEQTIKQNFVGCWVDSDTLGKSIEDLSIRKFSFNSKNQLTLSQYEPSIQCRAWTGINEFKIKGEYLYWYEFRAKVAADKKTIQLEYITSSGATIPFTLIRYDQANDFMTKLESSEGESYSYQIPKTTYDGWECADLSTVQMGNKRIVDLMNDIMNGEYDDIHGVLIVKNGKLVVEEYFNDKGKLHGDFVNDLYRDRLHHQSSVAKSVISALFGIAIDNGYIKDINEPLFKFFPEYFSLFDSAKKSILLKHVLTMSTGLKWNEFAYPFTDPRNSAFQWKLSKDNLKFYLERDMMSVPGTAFNYSGGCMMLLAEIVRRATGLAIDRFAETHLFNTIGVSKYKWLGNDTLVTNHSGGIGLRARDMAKLGLLFLNNGKWQGKKVVSEDWVLHSTDSKINTGYTGYGYQWWIRSFQVNDKTLTSFYAIGLGGQFILGIRELNMVLVFTGANFGGDWSSNVYKIVEEYILPSAS
ncbi:MAG TPA: serine hydrolase [Patescibacteria group bacterium]|nr:serine hydrolase [Patescibacteria group bacterium]